jgi:hypothetical protein
VTMLFSMSTALRPRRSSLRIPRGRRHAGPPSALGSPQVGRS